MSPLFVVVCAILVIGMLIWDNRHYHLDDDDDG